MSASEIDIFSEHERMISAPLGRLLPAASYVDFEGVEHMGLIMGASLAGASVRLSVTGCYGAPGLYSEGSLLISASDATLARLTRGPRTYRDAIESKVILRAADRQRVTQNNYFQAMSYCADYRSFFPPYFPLGRSSDGLMGYLLTHIDRSAWIGHLPFAISHAVSNHRPYQVSLKEAFKRLRVTDLMTVLITSCSTKGGLSMSKASKILGEQLIAISGMSRKGFLAKLTTLVAGSRIRLVDSIDVRLSGLDITSAGCRKDLLKLRANVWQSINEGEIVIASDLQAFYGSEETLRLFQLYVHSFGKLLTQWGLICTVTRDVWEQSGGIVRT